MDSNNGRRNFLKKFATVTGGVVLANNTTIGMNEVDQKVIIKTQALGFQWQTQDPFLFCVHHEDAYPKGNSEMGPQASLEGRNLGQDFMLKDGWRMYHGEKVPGFPGHSHRGFETITVVRKGMVDHSDSLGAAGRYGDGDVQWMTAGKGLQHAEMFPLLDEKKGNPMELFQIWINLPKSDKFVNPHFKMLWSETIPHYMHQDSNGKGTEVEVIAGRIEGYKAPTPPPNSWATPTEHEVAVWNINMEPGATWTLPKATEGVNRSLYFYEGDTLDINSESIENYHAADLKAHLETTLKAGNKQTKILILQGKPINEPVAQHGPFVMNTRQELQQAFIDFQQTRFGGWPWDRYDQVHDRSKGRFALHANGKLEERS